MVALRGWLVFLFLFAISFNSADCLEKVVLWGHKLHSHTHSYIHNAFYRAFQHLGYETYWLDNNDDISGLDLSGALFITEGQVDQGIPVREDCFYFIHNPQTKEGFDKYKNLGKGDRWLLFQVYTYDIHSVFNVTKVDTGIYLDYSNRYVFMPWATDLLPHEIEESKKTASIYPELYPERKAVNWIGTIGDHVHGNIHELRPFIRACEENGVSFTHRTSMSMEDNRYLISMDYIAPAIVGAWQKEHGYIPCRIFKNISYGKIGVTNSRMVYDLFDQKIVYNPDTYQLFYDAKKKLETMKIEELWELMDVVKEKHTYINRIKLLLWSKEQFNQESPS